MDFCPTSPVYAVVFTENTAKSPREVFLSLKEAHKFANSPEGKANGARFKKFNNADEAVSFMAAGDCALSPLVTSEIRQVPNEPTIPSPSLKITDYTALKKTIEKDDLMSFCRLVDTNPRYLINTSGDTASILMEGMRYNALHIAARHGKALFASKIISYVTDLEFVMKCYGTDEEDASFRMKNIVISILNTPDKGQCDTPLHIAAKFGHVDVIRELVTHPKLNKTTRNKEGFTPMDVACSRYNGEDKAQRKREMELLLNGSYVALYRTKENSSPAKIIPTEKAPQPLLNPNDASPLSEGYRLAAYAGPFYSQMDADEFYQKWAQGGRNVKLTDVDKGYERVGRELASTSSTPWAETWFFLPEKGPFRLDSEEGLELVNSYVGQLRKGEINVDPVRAKLNFDDDSDEDKENGGEESDEDDFQDALEESPLEDSLCGLSDALAGLKLNSPQVVSLRRESSDDDAKYATPPSTPPPVYLLGLPTKSDSDLFLALSSVPEELLSSYAHIRFFMGKISRLSQRTRADWPSKDSPRAARQSTPRRLFRP